MGGKNNGARNQDQDSLDESSEYTDESESESDSAPTRRQQPVIKKVNEPKR